jgi:hypothetical protein
MKSKEEQKLNANTITEIENEAIQKFLSGELNEAALNFRKAISLGSTNFQCRLLLSRAIAQMERRESKAS